MACNNVEAISLRHFVITENQSTKQLKNQIGLRSRVAFKNQTDKKEWWTQNIGLDDNLQFSMD